MSPPTVLLRPYRYAAAASSTLKTGLVSWWDLEEATGNRADAHGSNTLTMVGTVGQGTGKQGNAADFEGTADYLYVAAPHGLHGGARDFHIACWYKPDTSGALDGLAWVGSGGTAGDTDYLFEADSLVLKFAMSNGSWIFGTATTSLSIGAWAFCEGWYDSVAKKCYAAVNGEAGSASPVVTGTEVVSGNTWYMGRYHSVSYCPDGLIDSYGFWSRVLTSDERTSLYNGGAGLAYSDL